MDTGKKTYNDDKANNAANVHAFWNFFSDDEKSNDTSAVKTCRQICNADASSVTHTQANCQVQPLLTPLSTKASPCLSFKSDQMLTPLNIEQLDSFDDSPSISIFSVLYNQLNIPTPIPSPRKENCDNICKDEFCAEHDRHLSHCHRETLVDNMVTSEPSPQYKTYEKKSRRRCVKNIAKTFSSESDILTTNRSVNPTESVVSRMNSIRSTTPVPSPQQENLEDSNYVFHESENTSQKTAISVAIVEDSMQSQRGAKRSVKGASEWVDNKRKRLMNLGLDYCTKKGKMIHKKTLGPSCKCRYKCFEKISNAQRLYVFEKFWELGDRQKQWNFVIKYTKKIKKNRCLNRDTPNNRKYTIKYYLPLAEKSEDIQVSTVDVCKTMFLNTLRVSDRIVRTAWEKYDGSTEVERDKRGIHKNHKRVINEDMIRSVIDHVNAFVPIESHYLRKKTTKLYLEGSPTISRMFQLYNEWFDPDKYGTKTGTERQYREIVRKNFNLGIFIPKKDQCNVCHAYHNLKHPNDEQKAAQNAHQENKTKARAKKEIDKKEATASNGTIVSAVFDFEKVLNCPHGKVSLLYYKRKLACLNFTVFDMGKKKADCYMWDETVAKRGSNEVSSCLLDFIDANVRKGVEEFRFWSDNCTGQNRNRIVFSLYSYAADKYKITISHSFLEKGHTQNEGDSVHSTIEKASSLRTIYTPDEWRLLVRWARAPDHEPYTVINMTQDRFYDFKCKINDRLWQKDSQGIKISWMSIKEVCVTKHDPFKLMFRYDLNGEFQHVIVKNRTRRQVDPLLGRAYDGPLPITDAKYKDLMSLCREGIIPEEYISFFQELPTKNTSTADNESDLTDEIDSD